MCCIELHCVTLKREGATCHRDCRRDHRASLAFNALRDAFDLLSDAKWREEYDRKLSREDERARRRRCDQVGAAARAARHATVGIIALARLLVRGVFHFVAALAERD